MRAVEYARLWVCTSVCSLDIIVKGKIPLWDQEESYFPLEAGSELDRPHVLKKNIQIEIDLMSPLK